MSGKKLAQVDFYGTVNSLVCFVSVWYYVEKFQDLDLRVLCILLPAIYSSHALFD